jgi:hypothetical protein
MGVRKTVIDENSKVITFKGRISFIDCNIPYKLMGNSVEVTTENEYNNFIFVTNNEENRIKAMFGSAYTITITPSSFKNNFMLESIDGANVQGNDGNHYVAFKFTQASLKNVAGTDKNTLTIIVAADSNLVKAFGIGDFAAITVEVKHRREDYTGE